MHVFKWWGGDCRPPEKPIAEMAGIKKNGKES